VRWSSEAVTPEVARATAPAASLSDHERVFSHHHVTAEYRCD
jgi:hypothetical protein